MFASRVFQLVILAVAVLCIAQGTWWDEHRIPSRAMIRRQADNEAPSTPSSAPSSSASDGDNNQSASSTASNPPPQESTSSSASEESSSASSQPSETSASVTTTSEQSQSSTDAPSRTTNSEDNSRTTSSIPQQSTTEPPSSSTTSTSSQDGEDTKSNESSLSQSVSTSFSYSTQTNSDGTKETHTSKILTTLTPGLTDENDNGSSGMSSKTRNTIIGVVVGVGGAIVLGALGIVAWRIWGRKKQAEENDGLMAYDNGYSGSAEKSEPSHSPSASTSRRDPFQSTLENYHQPTPVNASSNF